MEIIPLAFESLGVRSSSTLIKTSDVRIVIDPAVALAPNRFGFPPHAIEEEAKEKLWELIKREVKEADILVVTHYHFDHIDPKEPDLYLRKRVLLKHPHRMINPSQKKRASSFLKSIKDKASKIEYADAKQFNIGSTIISFSKPLPHGSDATRGYVLEVSVKEEESFLFTSDVQGPILREQLNFIMSENPTTIIIDGPSTYFDSPLQDIELIRATKNLIKIIQETDVKRMIIDHHLIRDLHYLSKIEPVLIAGNESGIWIGVAAEFLEKEPILLEARRKELYGKVKN